MNLSLPFLYLVVLLVVLYWCAQQHSSTYTHTHRPHVNQGSSSRTPSSISDPGTASITPVSYEHDEGIRPSWRTEHGDRMRSWRAGEARLSRLRDERSKNAVERELMLSIYVCNYCFSRFGDLSHSRDARMGHIYLFAPTNTIRTTRLSWHRWLCVSLMWITTTAPLTVLCTAVS